MKEQSDKELLNMGNKEFHEFLVLVEIGITMAKLGADRERLEKRLKYLKMIKLLREGDICR